MLVERRGLALAQATLIVTGEAFTSNRLLDNSHFPSQLPSCTVGQDEERYIAGGKSLEW